MYRIEITLKSDLCASSGDGFASSIDTDVCTDKFGFPVIPARRLKGCLREAAEYIGYNKNVIDDIFGVTGSNEGCSLKLSDAVPVGYDGLTLEATDAHIPSAKITELFTSVKSATAIDETTNSAKDNSLRFTRTVNHFSPFSENADEMVFISDVEINSKYCADFARICKALRNIGYKRNRGYGAVKCRFIDENNADKLNFKLPTDDKKYTIKYTVKLGDNLMLPTSSSDSSADCISGTAVLGAFVGKFLRNKNDSALFEELFLKNNLEFSPLYITNKVGGFSVPAPSFLGKIKGYSGFVNMTDLKESDKEKIVKPLKNGYISFADESVCINPSYVRPVTETVYHHSVMGSTLYTQTGLIKGQLFSGTITGNGNYIKEIAQLISDGSIRFGRSKTAQYSLCSIVKCDITPCLSNKSSLSKGKNYAVLAVSDILVTDDYGNYSPSYDNICKELSLISPAFDFLNISDEDNEKDIRKFSSVKYKTISGFNSKRGLQNSHIRAISAGSTFIFTAKESCSVPKKFTVGEKFGEGFGECMIIPLDFFNGLSDQTVKSDVGSQQGMLSALIERNNRYEEMRNNALTFAENERFNLTYFNSAFIGRVTLMIKQAKDYNDLFNRVRSIKDTDKEAKIESLIKKSEAGKNELKKNDLWREYLLIIFTTAKYMLKEGSSDRK